MLRDVGSDTQRFQGAMDRLSMLLAIEMTREIRLEESPLQTPLAITAGFAIKDRIGVVPILRAGLALVGAFRGLIPGSMVLHLGMYRDEETAKPVAYYNKLEDAPEVVNDDPYGQGWIIKIEVTKAKGEKCPRCWKIFETKCDRCQTILKD